MKGKIILIEGTDCSGKKTQSELLIEKLRKDGFKCEYFSFPKYDSPTGRIIGGPFQGKEYISEGWFPEGCPNVDPYVSSLYYAADRKYNIRKITEMLDNGINVVVDRYLYSNMAHQGGKLKGAEREKMFYFIEELELKLLGLPDADVKIFLHMPYEGVEILRKDREEKPDQIEKDEVYLRNSEDTYKLIAAKYNFKTFECMNETIRSKEEISNEVYNYVINLVK